MGRPLTNWIKLFDGVHENVKTFRFARRMDWTLYETVGRLTRFWIYLSRHRPHGNIDSFADDELAMMFDSDCCGKQLRDALIETRLVVKRGRRGYCVNDWEQMTGRRFRELERSTKRSVASRNRADRASETPGSDASHVIQSAQATEKDESTNEVCTGESSSSLFSSSLLSSDSDSEKKKRRTLRKATWTKMFAERFWPAYPRKVAKGAAEIAWDRLGNRHAYAMTAEDLCDNVSVLLAWYIKREWKGRPDNGTDFPHPATWINAERFDDERIKEVVS